MKPISPEHLQNRKRFLPAVVLFILGLIFVQPALAQLRVDVSFKRSLYLKNEPIVATVTIENQTGRELNLSDGDGKPWFGFAIESLSGHLVPPRNPDYSLEPVQIGPGQTLKRDWNITPLYAISEYGSYHVQANVYVPETHTYVSSLQRTINITEGRTLWQQTAGVPSDLEGAGSTRAISLISMRLSRSNVLYLRIEDPVAGITFATHRLGTFVNFGAPNVQLDAHNDIHILQNSAPKVYLYTKVDLNGNILERKSYEEARTPPSLHKSGATVTVTGGVLQAKPAASASPGKPSKSQSLSDRPAELPQD